MVTIKCKTKYGDDPKGKARVYFTCQEADFEGCFEKICRDIFDANDCAVYYKEDIREIVEEADLETTLGQMNLFVVPVTFNLLTTENATMSAELPYARREEIPILPIMMEAGLDVLYSQTEIFGEMQFIRCFSDDPTEISYQEKLKKYLQSVLISDEMAKRIRAAFDTYIFLSYRKKDRKYANELMKLIHKNPECRDIAIWYDEFLTPGESFKENIKNILEKSELFTLLVTPSLLEEPNGAPNYVAAEEYPCARALGKKILPAEMDDTDKDALQSKFDGLPECVNPRADKLFHDRLVESLLRFAKSKNNDDPEHNFLIGLAYFDGIDVEVDRERGKQLITMAAEAGLPEAMEKLYDILARGGQISAEDWAERLFLHYEKLYGKEHEETLKWMEKLSRRYGFAVYTKDVNKLEKALELSKKVYNIRKKTLGENHADTVKAQSDLAECYWALGRTDEEMRLRSDVYEKYCNRYGEKDFAVIKYAGWIEEKYRNYGMYAEARELQEKLNEYYCSTLGEKHVDALRASHELAFLYGSLGEYEKAAALGERVYAGFSELQGESGVNTLVSACNLGCVYDDMGEREKAADILAKAYHIARKTRGEADQLTYMLFCALGCATLPRHQGDEERVEAVPPEHSAEESADVKLDLSDL